MAVKAGGVRLEQADGAEPAVLATGSAAGESGVSIHCVRFEGSGRFEITTKQHVICFVSRVFMDCRMAGHTLQHEVPAGTFAICPSGVDALGHARDSVDALLVAVDPRHFGLAIAEETGFEAQLRECLSGYDQELLHLARVLASESALNYPNGTLLWNEVASRFIDVLIVDHTSKVKRRTRGVLEKDTLDRLRQYVMANLDRPIPVSMLAQLAGRSPFNFIRVFTRSVGVSPHRYIVHLRLRRATELIRNGQATLAEVAVRTGFADQSHLTRWVRRVYGVSPSKLIA